MFDPVSLALNGASLFGGLFGKKRKHIDPEYLRQHFGNKAIADDTTELANRILNSPYGQQLLANAATSGQNFQTSMAAKAAASGLDPSSGASAGAGDFATSAGAQAQNTFERGVRSDVYQQAMPIAAAQNEALRNAYIADLQGGGYQDDKSSLWQHVGNAAGMALAARGPGQEDGRMAAPAGTGGAVAPMAATNGMAPAGNGSILARPAGSDAASLGFGGEGQANGLPQPSSFTRRLGARRLGMARAMIGQGAVRPYASG